MRLEPVHRVRNAHEQWLRQPQRALLGRDCSAWPATPTGVLPRRMSCTAFLSTNKYQKHYTRIWKACHVTSNEERNQTIADHRLTV